MKTAEDIVNDKNRHIVFISWDQTVHQTCGKMIKNRIGAIVVKKNDEFVGIWSERDLLRNICNEGFDPRQARICDYMSTPLHSAPHSTRIHKLEEMFLGLFLRHLLIEKDGKYIGMLSIGDVLRASLLEKDRQFRDLNEFVSWDFYENWQLGRSKKR
jgi:signal-transduction protein with cAMP-binding, CBS, and nucleotidyltransferase domain